MRKKIALKPRVLDAVVLIALVATTLLSPRFLPARSAGQLLEVRTPDSSTLISLADDGRYLVTGPLGEAVLIIRDRQARLENAPCPLKICEGMGPIGESQEVIICLPNRIFVQVQGGGDLDAVTR